MRILRSFSDWLEDRTGWREAVGRWVDPPAPAGATWGAALGIAVATCFGVLALTGVTLMTSYAPSPQSAWASVFYVEFVQDHGWVVRGLHYWAAQMLIVLAALHIVHGAAAGSYRNRQEIAWWLTLAVLGLAVGEGITGGLLPWDQRGWWARVVEGNIVGLTPRVGGWLERMMDGGGELGALGLARAYTLHVALLPVAVAGALGLRRKLAQRQLTLGAPPPDALGGRQLVQSAVVALLVVAAAFVLTRITGGYTLDAPADPRSDYPARPEWFLLPLFELRKFFHGQGELWGTTLIPLGAGLYLALLPWIDAPRRSRTQVLGPVALAVAGAVVLAWLPVRKDARDAHYRKQRAKADARAAAAVALARRGVPPGGALEMIRTDPELRGRDLFDEHCASCHVLGDAGDPKTASASKLDGFGTPDWIAAMIHDPDAPQFFGRGPYAGQMPSVDVRPQNKPPQEAWSPMVRDEGEKRAVAEFLASLGDEPGDPPRRLDPLMRARGEKIVLERCTTCHTYQGSGDDSGSGLAPELAGYGSIAWTLAQVANPASPRTYREGALDPAMKKHMPRFDKDLSAADVDLVARWARAHARGVPLR